MVMKQSLIFSVICKQFLESSTSERNSEGCSMRRAMRVRRNEDEDGKRNADRQYDIKYHYIGLCMSIKKSVSKTA